MRENLLRDQRLFERLDTEIPGRLKKSDHLEERKVLVKNLSANGVKVLTPHELSLGEKLSLLFEYPQSVHPLDVQGSVMWTERHDPHFWKAGIQIEKTDLMRMSRILSAPK